MSFRFSHFITVKIWCTRVVQLSISNFKWYTHKMIRLQVITVFFKFLFFTFWNIFFGFRSPPSPIFCFILLPVSWQRTHNSWISFTRENWEKVYAYFVSSCVSIRLSVLLFKCKNTKLVFMLLTFGCCTIEFLAFQNDKTTEYIFYRVI